MAQGPSQSSACARSQLGSRTLKGIDLQIRPVHHWLAPRVRAHVFLCMLAYYVEWHLRAAGEPLLFAEQDHDAAEAARTSPVDPALVSPATQRKRTTRRTDAGLPVSSYTGLIEHLASLTLNIMAVPSAPQATCTMLSRPTPLQAAALERLGANLSVSRTSQP
jgi:hypothetical protein